MLGLLIGAVAALGLLVPHPDSLSSSSIDVRGAGAELRMRCQVLSLLEVIDGLDANGDGEADAGEVRAKEPAILAYVDDHYRLFSGTDRDLEGGVRLAAQGGSAVRVSASSVDAVGYRKGAVDVTLEYEASGSVRDLAIELSLFFETSPAHIDYATVQFESGETGSFVLDARDPRVRMDPTGRGAFKAFVELGLRHILGGWDHLAFVVVLVLASRRLGSLFAVVTAFTVAHSLTLGATALGLVGALGYPELIEAAIALSIVYVAVDNLVHPRLERSRWMEAFAFGLVHGLGFAGFLTASLAAEPAKIVALFAFNLGVEAGQLLVVLALVGGLLGLRRGDPDRRKFLAPGWLRRWGSVGIALVGMYWFLQRGFGSGG